MVKYSVSGVQVHDAKLVAAICAHGIRYILTFNVRDFNRYDEIVAIHPAQTPVAVRPGSYSRWTGASFLQITVNRHFFSR
jgi:hypothetical protein